MTEATGRVAARRARFRDAVARLSERARSTQLLRMLLLPGAFFVAAGFVFMFFGWYGASRTAREIEQIPYLISGGLIGLGLVFVGTLLIACAVWMTMLKQVSEESDDRADARTRDLTERLGAAPRAPSTSSRRASSRRP